MKLMEGRRGLVFGVANQRSIAWGITQALHEHGASVGLNYVNERMERMVRPLAEQIGAPLCAPCDVTDDAQIDAFFEQAAEVFEGRLDFVVHSLAFARRDELTGDFVDTSRDGFALALDVSAYSLVGLMRRAVPLMAGGGSVVALTYYGAEKVVSNYNVMGPAKAALEASVRYLAAGLGEQQVRVNAISAGPVKTLAAAGIPGFRTMLKESATRTPLKRNVTQAEIADAALFLLSEMGRAVTGEVLHVDAGYHVMGH